MLDYKGQDESADPLLLLSHLTLAEKITISKYLYIMLLQARMGKQLRDEKENHQQIEKHT